MNTFLDGMFEQSSLPVLEAAMKYAGRRHAVIANNIANWNTPGYRAVDIPLADFQKTLRETVESGRSGSVSRVNLQAREPDEAVIMRHDGNTVDITREMTRMGENALFYNVAIQLAKTKYSMLKDAIRGRVG
ncbi:MAG: flagellar basal body rod protein FlgB [Planctomycetota bacterium]